MRPVTRVLFLRNCVVGRSWRNLQTPRAELVNWMDADQFCKKRTVGGRDGVDDSDRPHPGIRENTTRRRSSQTFLRAPPASDTLLCLLTVCAHRGGVVVLQMTCAAVSLLASREPGYSSGPRTATLLRLRPAAPACTKYVRR